MCGLICVPRPSRNRPCDASWRSYASCARFIGLRGERDRDRGGELDPFGVLGREEQREERVVCPLEREDAVVAGGLDLGRGQRDVVEARDGEGGVDLHGGSFYATDAPADPCGDRERGQAHPEHPDRADCVRPGARLLARRRRCGDELGVLDDRRSEHDEAADLRRAQPAGDVVAAERLQGVGLEQADEAPRRGVLLDRGVRPVELFEVATRQVAEVVRAGRGADHPQVGRCVVDDLGTHAHAAERAHDGVGDPTARRVARRSDAQRPVGECRRVEQLRARAGCASSVASSRCCTESSGAKAAPGARIGTTPGVPTPSTALATRSVRSIASEIPCRARASVRSFSRRYCVPSGAWSTVTPGSDARRVARSEGSPLTTSTSPRSSAAISASSSG